MKYCAHCGKKLKKYEKNHRNLCEDCYKKLLYEKIEVLKDRQSSPEKNFWKSLKQIFKNIFK